ncbi:MAG: hypothetical protein R3300_03645 [Candidatus Promineifilaceae bacterium]|nr:hypothetical protein [Candidatus Promineifilaceae bacterium]
MSSRRWAAAGLLFLLVSLALGVVAAGQIDAFLSIRYNAKELPTIPPLAVPSASAPVERLDPVAAIVLPVGAADDPRYRPAAAELAAALALRSGQAPDVVETGAVLSPGRHILLNGAGHPALADSAPRRQRETFSLLAAPSTGTLIVAAGHPLGHVYGLYELADRLRAGLDQAEFDRLDERVVPAMTYRLVDPGAVGVEADPTVWTGEDYRHVSLAFQEAILAEEPYVDARLMAEYEAQMAAYVSKMMGYGYNGIVIDGFLEYIDFAAVGDGYQVYGPDSPYRSRQEALRRAFDPLFRQAHQQGMMVVLKTDMLARSGPLDAYFQEKLGGIDAEDPALWRVYQQGLAELFDTFPYLEGLMIRIGEAGSIYNVSGWDYTSSLDVKSIAAVRLMLEAMSDTAAQYDKTIFFRTWSVGVGQAGDMHTNPITYQRLLGDFNPPNLVVSTKLVMGDFYSYLPFNPTLLSGQQRRIVEFQARREFESFNTFPNYLGPDHQAALATFTAANPQVEGLWLWTQGGGPWRAGPMTLYPFHGLWQTYDDNVYVTARLGWDPGADLSAVSAAWVRRTLSDDPATVVRLTQMLARSREAVLQGLYIRPFARQQVLGLGLEPPPMLWIFEWDIVSGASSVLATNYEVAKAELDQAIAEGFAAVALVQEMRALVADTDPASYHQPGLRDELLAALDYEANLLNVLAHWRQTFLRYYQWLDTGDPAARAAWRAALAEFETVKDAHLDRYHGHLAFPAYNFFAVEVSNALARRSPAMTNLARLLLLATILTLAAGSGPIRRRLPGCALAGAAGALTRAAFTPWRLRATEAVDRRVWVGLAVWAGFLVVAARLVYASFYAWVYLAFTLLALLLFVALLLVLQRRPSPRAMAFALLGPLLLQTVLLMVVVGVRGPGYLWLRFWTSTAFRYLYLTLTVATTLWLIFALVAAQRRAYDRSLPAALGALLLAYGLPLALVGAIVDVWGLDPALTAFNDQMAILPLGLSRILGITTHLDIPGDLALFAAAGGGLLAVLGLAGLWLASRRSAAGAPAAKPD